MQEETNMTNSKKVAGPTPFNPAQLATWPQAEKLATRITNYRKTTGTFMGGGVMPITTDPATSGIYIPNWISGPGGFEEPGDVAEGLFYLHFRFANGVSGINVGLILDKAKRYNGNWDYVLMSLNADLQS